MSHRYPVKRPASLRAQWPSATSPAHGRRSALALALAVACHEAAAQAPAASEEHDATAPTVDVIEVFGQPNTLYKARVSGDARHVADLADTPQTITVLTQTQLLDSGRSDLKDILAAQAGITLGTGENGNAFGDRYVIRGHEARSDVFVDGVRDPGMTTRESFATEQIEITKGPSSTFAGRGSTGGAINGITKQASTDFDFATLNTGMGTDSQHRVTFDTNNRLGERAALRINALHAAEDVPNRDPATRERAGALVSGRFETNDRLALTTDLYYLEAKDLPDLGGYFDQTIRSPREDVPVYAQTDRDFLDTEVATLTLKIDYDIGPALRLRNSMRYGVTDNGYVVTGARAATRASSDIDAPGARTMTLSTHQGWQEVDFFTNQLNFFWENDATARVRHSVVFGAELSDEQVLNGVYEIATGPTNCVVESTRNPAGVDAYCAIDATGSTVSNINSLLASTATRGNVDIDYHIETVSTFLMDTMTFNDRWSGFFGVRHDRFRYSNNVLQGGIATLYDYSDGFWNGHAGLVRSVGQDGNVYLNVSTSSNINGGESDVGGSCGYGGVCGTADQVRLSEPEQTVNLELGTKWDLLGDRLLVTAAAFQMTKDDVMESVGDAYAALGTLNTGKNRIRGVELSVAGNLTDKLGAQIGVASMESEVLEAFNPADIGRVLSNFADDSAFVQLRYQATPKFSIGGTITYKGEMYGGQPDTAAGFNAAIGDYSVVVPSYRVLDLFAHYRHSERLNVRVNVGNATDETYWTAAYRSGSFMYLGDARNVQATVSLGF
jgi:catecholate siderophore receptor